MMRGVRAMLAGVVWAAAMVAGGEGIPLYREWDTAVRFDGMESGEIGVDEEMRRELRAGPIREGIMGKELVVDLTGGGRSGVKVVGGTPEMWKGGTVNSGNDRESKKKEDDGWILSAIRQADGSSSNRTSLGTWLAGGGEEKQNAWGWLAGGVQAEAEGRAAERAAAVEEASPDWSDVTGNGEAGGNKEWAAVTTESGVDEVASALKREAEDGKKEEMSLTREALEMAGMKTDVWKPEGGDRRFATEALGPDWKELTSGGAGFAGRAAGTEPSGATGSGMGSGAGAEPSGAAASAGWSMSSLGEGRSGWGNMGAPGFGEGGGGLGTGVGMSGLSAGNGTGVGTGGAGGGERERWGGGWVVGSGQGSGLGFRGLDGTASGMDGAGTGWGLGAGSGVSSGTSGRSGGAVWEAWQKRGENSGGGFTPVWR